MDRKAAYKIDGFLIRADGRDEPVLQADIEI
jgi:hypothetical protein